jgi:hypothetical protein
MKNRRIAFTTTLLALACFGLSSTARAVLPPPVPDGGYPGGNTAEGTSALFSLTSGTYNTAVGLFSLTALTRGSSNTAIGAGTLLANTGDQNTATGAGALLSNTTGSQNTAHGAFALSNNTTGYSNTANGYQALSSNIRGSLNTANGLDALSNNTTGGGNTANGAAALLSNTTGGDNTANGWNALYSNTTGAFNTATGYAAGDFITSGSYNVCVGEEAGSGITIHNNIIAIGAGVSGISSAFGEVNNSCYIGNIFGKSVDPIGGTTVRVDGDGKLGTTLSSKRFKHDIKPMDKASEAILALKPVTFHYRSDAKNTPCFGLIAEEVAAVDPDLVVRDKKGEIWSVRYDEVNAMLLNEFLKEHRKVEEQGHEIQEQKATISELKKGMENVIARLKEQDSEIQKVSARLEASKPTSRVVLSKQ